MQPTMTWDLTIGFLTGTIATILAVGVISGIQILGSGLNSASIKIIFGIASLLNVMFQIDIAGFPLGLGLANNLISSFPATDFLSTFGFLIATGLCVITLISGLMVLTGGSE
jgi:hypothetical protein